MIDTPFQVVSEFTPKGDQPAAIDALTEGIQGNEKFQILMGATGTGKTFTMANVIARVQKPTLIISHNKTLAAQLYEEVKDLFPDNAVSYFVSYYDYYQPEAYIPQRDIYIEKDSSRNDDLDRLRLAATTHLVTRKDVIVVCSVSCIFGLGSPEEYRNAVIPLIVGEEISRQEFLGKLTDLQYTRAEMDFERGQFRVRGDVIEVFPAAEEFAYRIELFGDEIDSLQYINALTGEVLSDQTEIYIYPAVHYVLPVEQVKSAVSSIKQELKEQLIHLNSQGKMLEAQRLQARTKYDIEMIQEVGFCNGIENYSRHLEGRPKGSRPYTLIDYFGDDWLMLIDESHVTIPQIRAMYNGDQARKRTLVEHGFRLPSALDNRPLIFDEVVDLWKNVVFVTATPGPYELEQTGGDFVEQVIRPTGLVDPVIDVRPATGQVPDLLESIKLRIAKNERVLVTTVTKKLSEDLAAYLLESGIECRFLHSDIETLDRVEILRELREGKFDVLVGVNLLREGLDLPEVSLVAIMDADKAGFLRSKTSLIQQIGRAARNVNALVILYADKITPAMQQAMDETERRRTLQEAHNKENNITPQTIKKEIRRGIEFDLKARKTAMEAVQAQDDEIYDRDEYITELKGQMLDAAKSLEFEKAGMLRDKIAKIKASPELKRISSSEMKPKKPKAGMPGKKVLKKRKYDK